MDWHRVECIFQMHTGHPAVRPYNIQNTLKGLHFKVFIFNVFIEVKNHSVRAILLLSVKYRWHKESPFPPMQGYITSFCDSFWISFDIIFFSVLVIGRLGQMLCAGFSAKRSFKPLMTMSMIKGSEVIDLPWERWSWMFPAVKHSTFCNKS